MPPEYYKPASNSKGKRYHIRRHTDHKLVPATEEEIMRSDLEPCGICLKRHGLIPLNIP